MGHQPFESWMLSVEALMPDEAKMLHNHIESCDACRELSYALEEVESLFNAAPIAEPIPGFSLRWQTRLESLTLKEDLHRQKLVSWSFVSLTMGVALLVLTIMVVLFFATVQTPIQVFISGITFFAGLLTLASAVQVAFIPVLEVILTSIPPLWWFIVFIAISLSAIFTSFSIRKYLYPRRVAL